MEASTKPTCMTCAYAVIEYGIECRVKPPAPNYKTQGRMFPSMRPDDWCARFKLTESENGDD